MYRRQINKRVANVAAIPLTSATQVGDTFLLDNGEIHFVYSADAGGVLNIGIIPIAGITLFGLDSLDTEMIDAINQKPSPLAPTNLVNSGTGATNTLSWTDTPTFVLESNYEFQPPDDIWRPVTAKPQLIGAVTGVVKLRVKAVAGVNIRGAEASSAAFASSDGGGVETAVTFSTATNGVVGGTVTGNSVIQTNAAVVMRANTVNTINTAAAVETYFGFGANSAATGGAKFQNMTIALMPAATAPHTSTATAVFTISFNSTTNMEMFVNGIFEDNLLYADTDIIRIGTNGAGRPRVWRNGVVAYTSPGAALAAQTVVLFVQTDNAGVNTRGLSNVVKK